MRNLERNLLYATVLLLAAAVAYLAYLAWTIDRVPPVSPPPPVTPINGAADHAEIKAQLAKLAEDMAIQHAAIGKQIAPQSMDGLLDRIASIVRGAIKDSICDASTLDDCPRPPPPPSVVSNFTLLYENARLNDDEDIAADSVGVTLAPHERRLEKIAVAFTACQRKAASAVKFRVTGYSSTAKFRRKGPDGEIGEIIDGSDKLNLKTANLRAEVVTAYLREKGFEVENKPWDSFEDLIRPYLDDSQPGTDQQALNRTVFIQVLHAGACDLSRLPGPAR